MSAQTKSSDVILPLSVIAVIALLIFPLPTIVLDSLLTLNIAFALCLVVGTIYLGEASSFTSLPTILLLSTLFRLGLNISTTKQLLAKGYAPDIVNAFGNFVVNGNLAVGIVVFGIITLVQFLVIAKGAERISEVAARFTLDAMPGKQMSIDADVRAGIINVHEAKQLRLALHKESKLYGALDGAMKFVKGDAIVGLLITAINIVGGLCVGFWQQNLSFTESLSKYTLFTIGDGLVSQIPALLIAVAAGISVTRVQDKEDSFLGRELFDQICAQPQAIFVSGSVLIVMGISPGLPFLPFMLTGCFLFLTSLQLKAKKLADNNRGNLRPFKPKIYSPVILRLSQNALDTLKAESTLANKIPTFRSKIFKKWGLIVPDIHIEVDSNLENTSAFLFINGTKRAEVNNSSSKQQEVVETPSQTFNFSLSKSYSSCVFDLFNETIHSNLSEFVDDTQIRVLLETNMAVAEDLINNVIPEKIGITELTFIIRQLILEGIPVCEFRVILQAIAEHFVKKEKGAVGADLLYGDIANFHPNSSKTKSLELLADVRQALSSTISDKVLKGNELLQAWTVSPQIDHIFTQAVFNNAAIDTSILEDLVKQVQSIKEDNIQDTVILSSKYSRLPIASLLKPTVNNLEVIASNELNPNMQISILGVIELDKVALPNTAIVEKTPTQEQHAN